MAMMMSAGPWSLAVLLFALLSAGVGVAQLGLKRRRVLPLALGLAAAAVLSGLAGILGGLAGVGAVGAAPADLREQLIAQGMSQAIGSTVALGFFMLPLVFVLMIAGAVHIARAQKGGR